MHKVLFLLKRQSSLCRSTALRWERLKNHFAEPRSTFTAGSHREPVDGCHSSLRFLGGRRFSAASNPSHRQSGGKHTPTPPTVTSASQKQSSGKSTQFPPPASKVSQNQGGGESAAIPPQSRRLTNHLIVIGACSAIVATLLIFYQENWLKNDLREKQSEESVETFSGRVGQQDTEDVAIRDSQSADTKGGALDSLNDVKHLQHEEQHEYTKDDSEFKVDDETRRIEHIVSTRGDDLSKDSKDEFNTPASQADEQVSLSEAAVLSRNDNVHEESSAAVMNRSQKEGICETVEVGHEDLSELLKSSEPAKPSSSVVEEHGTLSTRAFNENLLPKSTQKALGDEMKLSERPSLSKAYCLPEGDENRIHRLQKEHTEETEAGSRSPEHEDGKMSRNSGEKDLGHGASIKKLETVSDAFDLLEVLHAAEQRQAEIDARLYEEDQRRLKEMFQRELKDAQARELMYAEDANRLAKEVETEKERCGVALKLEREKVDERLNKELKHKEEETKLKLSKAEMVGKTQLATAIAEEKLAYLEDMKDVKLQLEALNMAFYTRSEEARQSHTVHKLAVGTFAMEDAMMRGAPVEKEVFLILSSAGGSGLDPLLNVALSSLSQEVIKEGTRTPAQLHQKFETMTGALRELSLIPAAGGGLLSHAAARVVSVLKVREQGIYSDGIEAVISQVQRYLADGKLADAASLLERGVEGTKAEDLVADWIKHARDRAAMEQVLILLQAYATAVASSMA